MKEYADFDGLAFAVTWPPNVTFGAGAVASLGDRARAMGGRKALLVTDPGLVAIGLADKVAGFLRASGIEADVFGKVKPNPTMAEVTEGVARVSSGGHDFIVALGGGSSIDAAKVISMQLLSGRTIQEIEAKGVDDAPGRPLGFIAVPTTAGTGSEATTGALVKDASGKKYLVRSVRCRPAQSILDPELTRSVPARMTASTGMDAFIHAVGAYTNTQVNPIGDVCAQEAIRLVSGNLLQAIGDGNDLSARSAMMLASHLAGIAISQKGNDAIHGLSTAVESMVDCTHGESLSALMPHILRFNHEAAAPRYAQIARLMGRDVAGRTVMQAAAVGIEAMIELRDAAGTCRALREIGVKPEMAERLTELAAKGRSTLINCRKPDREQIAALYQAAI
ncbi:MAG: iron-containing alcohol dehydrogenase [Burkholderiaceae bacterium]|nr:iron-containing alcohol dehydrogenase [Burkholderiaceae bacterium]MEB2350330.1 iron-containing alcohol dehydrogenase [Burkholderiaceae bacterium]